MQQNILDLGLKPIRISDFGIRPKKKKRKSLTPAQRVYIWERPAIYGRKCNICNQRINRLSDLELDHTRAHSKGGKKLSLTHKACNRLKSSGSLGKIQEKLGIKSKRRKGRMKKASKRKVRRTDTLGIKKALGIDRRKNTIWDNAAKGIK